MHYHAGVHHCINLLSDALCGSIFRGREEKESRRSWLAGSALCRRVAAFSGDNRLSVMVPLGLLGCCCVGMGWGGVGVCDGGVVHNAPNTLLPPIKKIEKERKIKKKSVTGRLLSYRCHRDGALRALWGRDWRGSAVWKGRWWWWGGWLNTNSPSFSLLLSLSPRLLPNPLLSLVISSPCGER